MTDASMAVYTEPTSGMNLVPLPANIIPLGPNGLMPTPMRASSLSRLAELQRFLLQCDEPSYFGNYFELLHSSPPDALKDFLKSLKERNAWLDGQQEIELKRMRTLNLPGMSGHRPTANHLTAVSPIEADAFAKRVLEDTQGTTNISAHGQTPALNNGTPALEVGSEAGLDAAVEQHQLQRDSATPPNAAALALADRVKVAPLPKIDDRSKKGQAKLKRKRT